MRMVGLGGTGLTVSRLGFGTVYLGPDGDDLWPQKGATLLLRALEAVGDACRRGRGRGASLGRR